MDLPIPKPTQQWSWSSPKFQELLRLQHAKQEPLTEKYLRTTRETLYDYSVPSADMSISHSEYQAINSRLNRNVRKENKTCIGDMIDFEDLHPLFEIGNFICPAPTHEIYDAIKPAL